MCIYCVYLFVCDIKGEGETLREEGARSNRANMTRKLTGTLFDGKKSTRESQGTGIEAGKVYNACVKIPNETHSIVC